MRKLIAVFVMMFAVLAVGGCKKNPCEELANKFCSALGNDDKMCKEMKEEMGEASDEEKKACEEALKTIDEQLKMLKEMKATTGAE